MLGSRREDVDDAATHREVAAALDQIDAGVSPEHQCGDDAVDVDVRTLQQHDRIKVGEAADQGLQHGSNRGAHDAQGVALRRMHDPLQGGDTCTRRVGRGAEPLVRQRLPRGKDDGASLAELILDRIRDVLSLARSGRDDKDSAVSGHLGREGRDDRGPHSRDRGHVHAVRAAEGEVGRRGDARDGAEGTPQAGQRHAPDARSMPARNSSAKSGRPTRRSVT